MSLLADPVVVMHRDAPVLTKEQLGSAAKTSASRRGSINGASAAGSVQNSTSSSVSAAGSSETRFRRLSAELHEKLATAATLGKPQASTVEPAEDPLADSLQLTVQRRIRHSSSTLSVSAAKEIALTGDPDAVTTSLSGTTQGSVLTAAMNTAAKVALALIVHTETV